MKHKKKKRWVWEIIETIFFIIMGMLLMYVVIYTIGDPISYLRGVFQEDGKVIISESITEGCQGLNVFDSAVCLQKNVKSFYKYNMSNTGKDLTFEELKQQGGVCSHYSSLYYNAGEELGVYAEEVIINLDEKNAHIFTIISNTDGYCLLDGVNVQCFKFENE